MLAKIVDGILRTSAEPILIVEDEVIANPKEKDFLDAGYKPLEDKKLEDKEGYYQIPEYEDKGKKIVATYHYEEIEDEEANA